MCTLSKNIEINEKKKYVCQARNTQVIVDVKEQIWLLNVEYIWSSLNTPWVLGLYVDQSEISDFWKFCICKFPEILNSGNYSNWSTGFQISIFLEIWMSRNSRFPRSIYRYVNCICVLPGNLKICNSGNSEFHYGNRILLWNIHTCTCMSVYIHLYIHISQFLYSLLSTGNSYCPTAQPIHRFNNFFYS